jgi:hypothetical protein
MMKCVLFLSASKIVRWLLPSRRDTAQAWVTVEQVLPRLEELLAVYRCGLWFLISGWPYQAANFGFAIHEGQARITSR